MKIFLFALMLLVSDFILAQLNFQLNLEKDSSYALYTSAEMDMTQFMEGQAFNSKVTVYGTVQMKVTGIEGDLYTLTVEYTELGMYMNLAGTEIKASSNDDDDSNIFGVMLSGIMEVPFFMKMDRKGKIGQIWGTEKLWESAIKGIEDLPKETREQLIAQISSSFGGDKLKENLELVTALYPPNPVDLGESWKVKSNGKGADGVDMQAVYTLEEANDDFSRITGVSKLKLRSANKTGQNEISTFKGTASSELVTDAKTGWIRLGKITQDLEGEVSMPLNEYSKARVRIPSYILTTITLSSTPLD